jgi:CBS domain containing-hemolysin-like protein
VPLIGLFSAGVLRLLRQPAGDIGFGPRRRVEMLMREGVGYGLMSDEQSAIADRVLRLGSRTVRQEMVPWREVKRVGVEAPPQELWDLADRTSRSKFPVVRAGKVLGVVDVFDVLVHGRNGSPPIADLMHEVGTLPAEAPLREALLQLQQSGDSMAIVMQGPRPVGLVTVKDLVEPITGELASW